VLGSASRLRPVVMTASMAMLGLIPAALSTGVGSETAKPFAVVIIGGLLTATFFTLSMLPALYQYFEDKE
jgi:cobalt-zinc-cadmium resistance protein CzcA